MDIICQEWKLNPNVNPRTGRKISQKGKVYKELEEECIDSRQKTTPRKQRRRRNESDICREWRMFPTINPRTGRKISPHGSVSMKLREECNESPPEDDMIGVSQYKQTTAISTIRKINTALRTIGSKETCMSGPRSLQFRSNFSSIEELGSGSFGKVYKVVFRGEGIAVKEAYTEDVSKVPKEAEFGILMNDLLFKKKSPNFLATYMSGVCMECKISLKYTKKQPVSPCYLMFMELAYSDLGYYTNHHSMNLKTQLSVLFQLLMALYCIHHLYSIFHTDIKTINVLLKRIQPGGYFEYVLNGKSYYVENAGLLIFLSDFGVAECLSPAYSHQTYFGTRNAQLALDRKGNPYWIPVTINGNRPLIWKDEKTMILGTENVLDDYGYVSIPQIELNSDKFPPFEFYHDIQDVLRMFTGGARSIQEGWHNTITVDPYIKRKLKSYVIEYKNLFHVRNTVKFVVVKYLIRELYDLFGGIESKPKNILGRYVM